MDWIRENKSQATILGIFGALALALGVLLFLSHSDYSASLEALEGVTSKLVSKEKAPLYPNEANVQALEAKVAEYEDAVGKLSGTLLALQSAEKPKEDVTDTAFQAKLKQRIAEVREKVGQGSKVLPKDFAFGFDIYTISLPRSPEAARELNDYFTAVDAVVSTAIDAGIDSIDLIKRSELAIEKGTPPAPANPAPQPKKSPPKSSKAKKKGASAPVSKPVTQVVERRTLTLNITADQIPLQGLLNALASPSKMPYFTVVRLLRVENNKQEGPLKSTALLPQADIPEEKKAPKPEVAPDGAAPAVPKVEIITPPAPSRKDAMMVLGGEKLHVHLEIDLVRFVEPAAETAGAGSPQ